MPEAPVVVIGAGPQGLAAAAHLRERGIRHLVLEAGDRPAASVAEWGHVRLFSGWSELVDPAAARLLAETGWVAPESGFPTGAEWIARYLAPLADALGDVIRVGARVVGVGRKGRDLIGEEDRAGAPFVVHVRRSDGTEERLEARAVLDASGTWGSPAPAGADGLPAIGEAAARRTGVVTSRIPDASDADRDAGGHVLVVGNGHSAATAIIELARVAAEHPTTRVTWVLRRAAVGNTFGGADADALPARGALGARARAAVDAGAVELVTGFRTERIDLDAGRAVLVAEDGRALAPADRVVVLTGFRPDLAMLSELRLDLDRRLEAPPRLAVEIDPVVHSCGTVRATGATQLAHPEPDFYVIGAKSYGRAPTFLALTGYEQVRSVVAALAGDREAADRVELRLPATGVCGGSGVDDGAATGGSSCCAPAPAALQIGRAPATV